MVAIVTSKANASPKIKKYQAKKLAINFINWLESPDLTESRNAAKTQMGRANIAGSKVMVPQ